MKIVDIRTRVATASTSKKGKTKSTRSVQVILTEVEREVLLKACKKYRHTIPGYLKSKQPEIDVLDAIIKKVS